MSKHVVNAVSFYYNSEDLGLKVSRSPRNAALRPATSVKIPSGIWHAPTLQDMKRHFGPYE